MFLVEGKFDSSLCLPAILVFHFRRDHFGFHYDLKAGKSLGTAFVVLRVSVFSFSEACFRSFEPSYRVFWPETEIGEFLRESNLMREYRRRDEQTTLLLATISRPRL